MYITFISMLTRYIVGVFSIYVYVCKMLVSFVAIVSKTQRQYNNFLVVVAVA